MRDIPPDLTAGYGLGAAFRGLRTQIYPEVDLEALRDSPDPHLQAVADFGLTSGVIVPLSARGRVLGGLAFFMAESDRHYRDDDIGLAEELGRRAAVAVDNARLYGEQRYTAATLQQSLLPRRLPMVVGLDIAAAYHAAAGSEVGGDFYDVFAAGDGWTLAVGDVCGRGVEAAALTALARYTLRAAARSAGPAGALMGVNAAIDAEQADTRFLTIATAMLEQGPGGVVATVACGGHPRPMLLRADGRVEIVGHHGTVLGIYPDPDLPEDTVVLQEGDTLVLYTDGVIDARLPLDALGEDGLAALLGLCQAESAADVVAHIERAVLSAQGGVANDDTALLAVRVTAPTLSAP